MSANKIQIAVAGSFVVTFSYTEKKGARRTTLRASLAFAAETPEAARAACIARRGHLDGFQVLGVAQETAWRPMTNAEISAIPGWLLKRTTDRP